MELASDVIARMKAAKSASSGKVVRDWRDQLPPGSKWFPGCPGNPACKTCDGTGYVRLELPMSSPYFGKILLCDCVNQKPIPPGWKSPNDLA
jgi:hypothetical protein